MKREKLIKRLSKNKITLFLFFIAIICFGIAIYLSSTQYIQNKKIANYIKKNNIVLPSTKKITETDFSKFQAPSDYPKYLFIPSINVKTIVKPVGLTKSSQIGTPDNVFTAAWYIKSSKPGEIGATLIDGHVSSWTSNGVFYNLKKLKAGDTIQIQKGNNSILNYKVVKTAIYDSNSIQDNQILDAVNPKVSGLNLITCYGKVDKNTNEFQQRLIVYSQLK